MVTSELPTSCERAKKWSMEVGGLTVSLGPWFSSEEGDESLCSCWVRVAQVLRQKVGQKTCTCHKLQKAHLPQKVP